MKTLKTVVAAFIFFMGMNAMAAGINFTTVKTPSDFQKILDKAKQKDQLVFIDFTADWCVWCVRMDEYTFSDKEVAAYFKDKIVAVKIFDDSELFEVVSENYQIESFPTFAFVAPDEMLLEKQSGYLEADEFIELSKKVFNNYVAYTKAKDKFEQNPSSKPYLGEYLMASTNIAKANIDDNLIDTYFANSQPETNNPVHWKIISKLLKDLNNKHIQFLINNYAAYADTIPFDEMQDFYIKLYDYNYTKAVYENDEHLLNECFEIIDDVKSTVLQEFNIDEFIVGQRIAYYEYNNEWEKYGKEVIGYINALSNKDAEDLFEYFATIYMNVQSRAILEDADKIAAEMLDYSDNFFTNIVYALTRSKCNDKSKAYKLLDKANKLAETEEQSEAVSSILAYMESED